MKSMTRRGLLGMLRGSTPESTRSFLDDFYRGRSPQKLPPITLHPTVLEYAEDHQHDAAYENAQRYGRPDPYAPLSGSIVGSEDPAADPRDDDHD